MKGITDAHTYLHIHIYMYIHIYTYIYIYISPFIIYAHTKLCHLLECDNCLSKDPGFRMLKVCKYSAYINKIPIKLSEKLIGNEKQHLTINGTKKSDLKFWNLMPYANVWA